MFYSDLYSYYSKIAIKELKKRFFRFMNFITKKRYGNHIHLVL
ncbi:hypothetical protein T190115A13A_200014 [Tenacibaculum sp. 190524A02b]|uniref:Transposase n=1 Tax=Tenacibaculum vairaonense TaxID=3137860 RepID=A0ABP1FAC7_9FLAO